MRDTQIPNSRSPETNPQSQIPKSPSGNLYGNLLFSNGRYGIGKDRQRTVYKSAVKRTYMGLYLPAFVGGITQIPNSQIPDTYRGNVRGVFNFAVFRLLRHLLTTPQTAPSATHRDNNLTPDSDHLRRSLWPLDEKDDNP